MLHPRGGGCKEGAPSPRCSVAAGVRHGKVPGGLRDLTSPSEIECEGHSHRRKLCLALGGTGTAGGAAAGSSMSKVGVDGAETPASFTQR